MHLKTLSILLAGYAASAHAAGPVAQQNEEKRASLLNSCDIASCNYVLGSGSSAEDSTEACCNSLIKAGATNLRVQHGSFLDEDSVTCVTKSSLRGDKVDFKAFDKCCRKRIVPYKGFTECII